ncbi:MAG: alpha/beta hydrolase [Sinobacteraceae bacterium]|nr:alpha/beta hydrolase [Nevskiaceae bacterium]
MDDALQVPARPVPLPASISQEARTFLAWLMANPLPPRPATTDAAAWRAATAAADAGMVAMMAPRCAELGLQHEQATFGDTPTYIIRPKGAPAGRVYLDFHGGGLTSGGGEATRLMGCLSAVRTGIETYAVDYRMPPDHPYPAALDDAIAAYRALVERFGAERIVIGGISAGGNIAAGLVLRARDEGLPLPAGLVLLTPEVDLTESGDSFQTNRYVDLMLPQGLAVANQLYAGGHDLAHPYLSPLFGDFTKGYPRTFLQAGTRDLFLSNTVRMHRALLKAGIPVELHIFEGMPHGGFGGAPEDEELDTAVRAFIASCWR